MTDELKPCPFCGSEAKVSHARDGEVCNVRCAGWSVGNCLGAGPNCYTEAEAVAGWNRRAPLRPAPLTVEQIEALSVWEKFVGLWPETREEITRAIEAAQGEQK